VFRELQGDEVSLGEEMEYLLKDDIIQLIKDARVTGICS